jgi:hypothetical protein
MVIYFKQFAEMPDGTPNEKNYFKKQYDEFVLDNNLNDANTFAY